MRVGLYIKSMWKFREFLESMVSTGDLNRQIEMTFKHILPGDWGVYREDRPYQHLRAGGILLLGRDVMRSGDQYFASVRWQLYDEDARFAGIYKSAPEKYDSVRGGAHVSFHYGVQGYRPGDVGALGGLIKVNGIPMTPIRGEMMGYSGEADTVLDASKAVKDLIEYYDLGYFKDIPGGVSVRSDYYSQD